MAVKGNPWAVLIALCLGFFMTLLDTTVIGVAIPDILGQLHITYNEVLWVSNTYVLVLAVLLIVGGRMGDLFGKRRMYLVGVAVFTVASLMCALAQDAAQLIAARSVQGLGAALLIPQTMSIIVSVFPAERRGSALGVWGAVAGVATITGPPLGGFLISTFDWRWIFTINVPIGLIVLVAAPLIIPAGGRTPRSGRFDLRGTALLVAGLSCLTYGLQEGQRLDWNLTVEVLLVAGVVLLTAFVLSERRPGTRQPLVPLTLFANRNFSLMNAAAVTLSVGIMSLAIGFQLYAQSVLGMSALEAGMVNAPLSLMTVLIGPYAGRLADSYGGKFIVVGGLSLFTVGIVAFGFTAGVDSSAWSLLPSLLVMGVGLGLTFAPLSAIAMHDVQPTMAGAASGMINATRQFGSVIGTAGFGVLLQNQLVGALSSHARSAAGELPAQAREGFVAGVEQAAGRGIEFDQLRDGTAVAAPDGASGETVRMVGDAARRVFSGGFVDAFHVSLAYPVVALVIGVGCCLLVKVAPVQNDVQRGKSLRGGRIR
nr:DHA2 family efflux MFS transporter permease subunit [Kibdelosporangium sp. MJ126-NF4]CEL20185.1 drug resistance transporter, EmrB/QacA subfamily [Kibdelosporangium sp. MJ126-NF4]CTQ97410.1 drug resistance transporter, EmrB/QacA subfamily [Kibdelosporangium sp. MJ126-NF4]